MRFYAHIFFDLKDVLEITQIRHKIIQLLPYEVDVGALSAPQDAALPKPEMLLVYESIYHDSVKTIVQRLCPDYSVMYHPCIQNQTCPDLDFAEWWGPKLV